MYSYSMHEQKLPLYHFRCLHVNSIHFQYTVYLQAPKKIAAWLLKRQLPSNPDDRGTTRKTITLLTTAVKTCIRLQQVGVLYLNKHNQILKISEQDTEWKHDTFKMNSAQKQTLSSQV
jgi:hypothetical protein